jgi:hypothetical protein
MSACEGERHRGSPALKRRRKCYFHEGLRLDDEKFLADPFGNHRFVLPPLEDANAVQVGLMKVLQWLGSGRMDPKIAGLMLHGLQTAACNLKNVKFEAEKPTDVVIDRNDVDRTCLNGPQWYARDFVEEKEEDKPEETVNEETVNAPAASGGQAAAEADASAAKACRTKRADTRKRPEPEQIEPGVSPVWDFFQKVYARDANSQSQSGTGIGAGAG